MDKSSNVYTSLDLLSMNDVVAVVNSLENKICDKVRSFFSLQLSFTSLPAKLTNIEKDYFNEREASGAPSDISLGPLSQLNQKKLFQDEPHKALEKVEDSEKNLENSKRKSRINCLKRATPLLQEWLTLNKVDPYPSYDEKCMLSKKTGLTFKQITNWFINKRMRDSRKGKKSHQLSKMDYPYIKRSNK